MFDLVALTIALQAARGETFELAWRPAPGTVLEREIEFEVHGGLGEEHTGLSALGVGWLSAVSVTGRLRVRDEVLSLADGRPLVLAREFERLSTVWDGRWSRAVRPELLDRPLRFTWDELTDSYAVAWVRPRSDDAAPPALREDLDLRAFLPDEPVRLRTVWRVPVSSVAGVLAPAGNLHVDERLSETWGFAVFGEAFDLERLRRVRDGEVQCRLERIVRVDGRRLAVIDVGWTWWGTIDPFLTPSPDTWIGRLLPDSVPADIEGRAWGRLLWDLEGGHAREFELQAELTVRLGARGGTPIHARGTWFTTITPR